MPKFKFAALTAEGATVKGTEEAFTLNLARRALIARDLTPVDVQEKKSFLTLELTKKKVPRRDLMHFSRQMAVFMKAGIPVLEALDVLTEEGTEKVFQQVLAETSDSLRAGETFAAATLHHPEAFPPFFTGILRSAELTGNLDVVLDQLADYIDRDLEARRKISSALVYPMVVLVMAVAAILVITVFVLPRFQVFFKSLNAKLPLPTRLLIGMANFVAHDWYVVLGTLALLGTSAVLSYVTARGRRWRDIIVLKVPVLGDLVRTAILERFCRILSSMVGAGVPLPDALEVTSEATTNAVYRDGMNNARSAMLNGEGLAGPLGRTELFPSAARHMFVVGENTGTMDKQLETAAIYFDRELDYKLKRFTSLFEPAIVLFVGLVVGFVAVALISAMYGIYNQVHIQ